MSSPSASSPRSSPEPSSRAQDLYARYLTRRQKGESLSFESWCVEHPSEADDLRRLHGQYEQWKSIFEPLGAICQDPAAAGGATAWRTHLAS